MTPQLMVISFIPFFLSTTSIYITEALHSILRRRSTSSTAMAVSLSVAYQGLALASRERTCLSLLKASRSRKASVSYGNPGKFYQTVIDMTIFILCTCYLMGQPIPNPVIHWCLPSPTGASLAQVEAPPSQPSSLVYPGPALEVWRKWLLRTRPSHPWRWCLVV